MHTQRFWNNLHQVRPKVKESGVEHHKDNQTKNNLQQDSRQSSQVIYDRGRRIIL